LFEKCGLLVQFSAVDVLPMDARGNGLQIEFEHFQASQSEQSIWDKLNAAEKFVSVVLLNYHPYILRLSSSCFTPPLSKTWHTCQHFLIAFLKEQAAFSHRIEAQ
jgi:hypothetical protein